MASSSFLRGFFLILLLVLEKNGALKVATFNCLAPVHKSMAHQPDVRESEFASVWLPRAKEVSKLIDWLSAHKGVSVVCLQEFWFHPRWVELFETHPYLKLETARRTGRHPHDGSPRSDGVATLYDRRVFRKWDSQVVDLSGGRVALCVGLEDVKARRIVVGNLHLPFPTNGDALASQVAHAEAVAAAVHAMNPRFSVVAGDFNCRALDSPALALESAGFTNCARAYAEESLGLSGIGGSLDFGVTHRTHLGDSIQCDHVFARDYPSSSNTFGYFDNANFKLAGVSRVVDFLTSSTQHNPSFFPAYFNVSDHLPVTAEFEDCFSSFASANDRRHSNDLLGDDDQDEGRRGKTAALTEEDLLDWDSGAPDRDAIR